MRQALVERASNIAIHKLPTIGALVEKAGNTAIHQESTRRLLHRKQ